MLKERDAQPSPRFRLPDTILQMIEVLLLGRDSGIRQTLQPLNHGRHLSAAVLHLLRPERSVIVLVAQLQRIQRVPASVEYEADLHGSINLYDNGRNIKGQFLPFQLEEGPGLSGGSRTFTRQPHDLRPALDEGIIGEGLGRPLLALAQGVEAVAEFARRLGL